MKNITIVCGLIACALAAAAEPPARESAPRLSDNALHDLRRAVTLVESADARGEELLAAGEILARQQYAVLPACRGLYKSALDGILQRLLEARGEAGETSASAVRLVAAYETFYRGSKWAGAFGVTSKQCEAAFRATFGEPWDHAAFHHPVLGHVDFPSVVVRQALWDESTQRLLFVLAPASAPVTTIIRIVNIPTNYVARLEQDGRQIAAIDEHGQASGARVANRGPGEVEVTVTLEGPARFAVLPE